MSVAAELKLADLKKKFVESLNNEEERLKKTLSEKF